MPKRKFKLPGVEELNKDQDRVLRLPEDGQFLVVGGPGTGKSVVALLRTIKFSSNDDYIFLTYNRVLNTMTQQLTENLNINTLLSFFNKKMKNLFYGLLVEKYRADFSKTNVHIEILKKMFSGKYPSINFDKKPDVLEKISDEDKGEFERILKIKDLLRKLYDHHYEEIINEYQKFDVAFTSVNKHLIIDEGQDMSVGYYKCLQEFGYENFFIVADQNQQITEENSSRQDLTDLLALEVNEIIELKQNYRNSNSIALVAQHFYTDIASPKPELPPNSKTALGKPILFRYNQFNKCIEYILREADRDPSNLIGIIVAKNNILDECKKRLENMEIDLDNPKPKIQTYKSAGHANKLECFQYIKILEAMFEGIDSSKDYEDIIESLSSEQKQEFQFFVGIYIFSINAYTSVIEDRKKLKKVINEYREYKEYKKRAPAINIDFSEGGIVVLNDKSIKGLEFDVVFILLNGFEINNNELDVMKKRLYVMSSRAIKKLVFFQSKGNILLDEVLPPENILPRQDI